MKKAILLVGIFLTMITVKAQIVLTLLDDTPIENGKVFTYNTVEESPATLYYKIKNTSANPASVRIQVTNLVNTTGMGLQFCFLNTCLPGVDLNAIYPNVDSPAIYLEGNTSTVGSGYNMWNQNSGSGTFPIDYVFKFYQVDDANNQIGESFVITYRFDPFWMGVSNVNGNNNFAKILNTRINQSVSIDAKEKVSYQIYSVDGKIISTGNLNAGVNSIQTSNLKNGVYLLYLKNSQGNTIQGKLLK